ncbi:unnamed protein product [Adineta steineri]|uniref:CSD domain-containing protein n=1 Tax=Adineta steineri TaxID=433720 RepID=A0A816BMN4_9BILA|nr:unnamed protein product [Adineta steineri]CAF1611148.1 unnamed protein product [Adineta steineri]
MEKLYVCCITVLMIGLVTVADGRSLNNNDESHFDSQVRRFYADTDQVEQNNHNVRRFNNEQDSDEDDDTLVKRLEYLLQKHLDLSVTRRSTGTVKWFNAEKGFGYITPDDGSEDVIAHFSAIASSGYRPLEEGQQVQFDTAQGAKGLQAENIQPL